ncbi:MAG: peptidoglycan DD-metalloendopeptidase family protein [Nitriliruptoraceae bacterium]|nr:peptidoglycan DD-metalloendopeptidase family protein [Nitriliruptoraceae bacterium]
MRHGARWRGLVPAALLVLLVPAVSVAQPAGLDRDLSGLDDEQEQIERELDQARVREGTAREQLDEITRELELAEAVEADTRAQLEQAEARLASATANAEAARTRLVEVTAALESAEAELDARRAQLDARVRAAFKYGGASFLEAFVGTQDIADFLNSNTYVASVLDGDKQLIADVTELLAAVEAQRAEALQLREEADREAAAAEQATAEIDAALAELEMLAATIRDRRVEQQQAMDALASDRSSLEDHLAGLEAESRRIESQLAAIARQQAQEEARQQAEAEAQRRAEQERIAAERRAAEEERRAEQERLEREAADACGNATAAAREALGDPEADVSQDPAVVDACGEVEQLPEPEVEEPAPSEPPPASGSDGAWVRPVPGAVTSPFGPRWGRNHNGVDLRGSVGTTVVASRPGTVVHVVSSCHPTNSFGCGGGFGNYVLVSHRGGMATIYAHLSSVSVGVGSQVASGQTVGAVGNSGSSYGAHLHFEVREGGAARNPCSYIRC